MERVDLGGVWRLSRDGELVCPEGRLPGSNYLDLMAAGKLEDPFWGLNEEKAKEAARHDYRYEREFRVPPELLAAGCLDLAAEGLDTLCTLYLNGRELGKTDNINRLWRFDVKPFIREGENTIRIDIQNPFPYVEERQKRHKIPGLNSAVAANGYIRKTPCHFGWDWGPSLPPAGLIGAIQLEAYDLRLRHTAIIQTHREGEVVLDIAAELAGDTEKLTAVRCRVYDPDGGVKEYPAERSGGGVKARAALESPRLWWCNGLGDQPLYRVVLLLEGEGGLVLDRDEKTIGLRTITLDTSPDAWGNQFRFEVNGVPIFAKGADWIPPDSFITRTTRETLEFYIKGAQRANMNMLRVWGGGNYGSDDFYDLCDQYGILVWQDFIFACAGYPLFDQDFVENVRQEARDNIYRLRHHASLALWCGNNENEFFRLIWKKSGEMYQSNLGFYFKTLPEWVAQYDGTRPYWPGSPSSGDLAYKTQDRNRGDTHLWQIWHGMRPIEAFRQYPTRFCSEFGMESMPSMKTIRGFNDAAEPSLFDPVMLSHQKSGGGNEKMLYYLLAKYRNPRLFEDFVYLSQLVQSDTIRFATEHWRRGMGRHNGALFWQYNDCWPVASWASVDYGKQYKALQYHARHFNKMVCLSNDYYRDRVELYCINEYPRPFAGTLGWKLSTFSGDLVSSGSAAAEVPASGAKKIVILRFKDMLKGKKKNEVFLEITLTRGNEAVDEKTYLLVPDREALLPKPKLSVQSGIRDGAYYVTVKSDVYTRYLCIEGDDQNEPWSDNFFDLPPGREKTITALLPSGGEASALEGRLHFRSLAEVEAGNGLLKDRLLRFSMLFKKGHLLLWLLFKLM
jgi:beta-mannosidase